MISAAAAATCAVLVLWPGTAARAQTPLFLTRPPSVATGTPPLPPIAPPDAAGPADLRARQAALLARTLRDPEDYEAAFAYVAVSTRLRDNEAAIGTLERLVAYNSDLARANYELGLLYYQLGSYDAAARYLRAASQSPGLDEAVRARVDALYPDAVKGTQQSRWSVFVQAGLRGQTNASFIPSGGVVRAGGQDLLVAPADRRRADVSAFGLAQVGNDYDLQNQRGDVLETRVSAFGSKQVRAADFDFGYVEASFGPRFGLPELGPGASIKPYVVGQTSALRAEASPYVSSGGGGVTMRLPVLANLTLDPGIEARALSVRGIDEFRASTFSSGQAVSGYLVATAGIAEGVEVEMRFVGLRADGARPWQSFAKGGAALAVSFEFDPPSELIARRWKVSPFLGGDFVEFDRANPAIDPRTVRRDREFSAGIILDAPLTAALGLAASLQYDRVDSNLPNYRQRGLTVLAGPTARF